VFDHSHHLPPPPPSLPHLKHLREVLSFYFIYVREAHQPYSLIFIMKCKNLNLDKFYSFVAVFPSLCTYGLSIYSPQNIGMVC
jgi:hypothetical protein